MSFFDWKKFIYISTESPELIDFKAQISAIGLEPVLTENILIFDDVTSFGEDYADVIDRIIDT